MSYVYEKDLVKENDYEAILEDLEVQTIPTGKNKLKLSFRIRDDVEQSYKNKWLTKDIWESKEEPGVFNRKQINQLLGTQKVQEGQEFPTINDVIGFLKGSAMIIHVSIEWDDYRGENVNTISYFKKTKVVPQVVGGDDEEDVPQSPAPAPVPPKPAEPAQEGVVIGDDDLPF